MTVFQVFTLKRAYVSPRIVSTKKRADMRKRNLCHVALGLLGLPDKDIACFFIGKRPAYRLTGASYK